VMSSPVSFLIVFALREEFLFPEFEGKSQKIADKMTEKMTAGEVRGNKECLIPVKKDSFV
jgi:hypothetical protein